MATCESLLEDEVAVLQSIYLPEELEVKTADKRGYEIKVSLHPHTADNDDEKFVFMQLVINLDERYPQSKPKIAIKMSRGISDAQLESILSNMDSLASKKIGEEMMFVLIEYAKECLTNNNKPECPCPICLQMFEEEDDFIKTECFHYFHRECLSRYVASYSSEQRSDLEVESSENQNSVPCPICRADVDASGLKTDDFDSKSTDEQQIVFKPSEKFLSWRKQMKAIFLRQQKRGGIIDLEAEKNKYLIATKKKDESQVPQGAVQERDWTFENGTHIVMSIDHWTNDEFTTSGRQASADCPKKNTDTKNKQFKRSVTEKEPSGSSSTYRSKDKIYLNERKQGSVAKERLECYENSSVRKEMLASRNPEKNRALPSRNSETGGSKYSTPIGPSKAVRLRTTKPPPGFGPL